MTAPLEPTNEPYAIAKIAGIRLCDAYNRQYGTNCAGMPLICMARVTTIIRRIHMLPALIRRFHEAKEAGLESVTCWGSGKPLP